MVQNKSLIFKGVPTHAPLPDSHLGVEVRDFDLEQNPPSGGATGKTLYVSLDPYMRGLMRDPWVTSYSSGYTLGEPMTAYTLVQVIKSDNEKYRQQDIVYGQFPVAEYTTMTKERLSRDLVRKVHQIPNAPLSNWLSVLGSTGLTAYSSLYEIGKPKRGETIFVTSAAGAVGLFVGQIAKIEGLMVVGSVGDDAKVDFIKENGFDDGFNYKKEKTSAALQRLAPKGIDIYYDNVGGEQLEAALAAMNNFGRIGRFNYSLSQALADGDSCVRDDLPIQQALRGAIRRERSHADRWETPQDGRLRRYGLIYGPKVASREG